MLKQMQCQLIVHLARTYCKVIPLPNGKRWIIRKIEPLFPRNENLIVKTRYGTRISLKFPEDHGWEYTYLTGDYETGTAKLIAKILKPGDIVVDIGANLGWFTTFFAHLVSPGGEVHAFEPMDIIYQKLICNCEINLSDARIFKNNIAIGDKVGRMDLYFNNHKHAKTSLKCIAYSNKIPISVTSNTLDNYWERLENKRKITLIKVDVEGAEKLVVDGARGILSSTEPPLWLLEINFYTAKQFGFHPHELLERFTQRGYQFIRIKYAWGKYSIVNSPQECADGDNVLCFIPALHKQRISGIL